MTNQETPTNGETVSQEIERKFLVPSDPDGLELFEISQIQQGYLPVRVYGDEKRVRHEKTSDGRDIYTLTEKKGVGLVREEEEKVIDKDIFDKLWAKTEGSRVEKTRHKAPYENVFIEYDVYEGDLRGLRVAEVEFIDTDQAKAFEAPEWFGDEVTGNPEFSNHSLAKNGSPV